MRRRVLIIVLSLLACGAEARADSASKHAKVKELFKLTFMENRMEQSKAAAMAQAQSYASQQLALFGLPSAANKETTDYYQQVYALIATRYDWEKNEPLYEQVYVDQYSEEELDGILAFYKSTVGQALLAKTPEITKQLLEISKEQFDSLQPQIQELTKAYVSRLKAEGH